MTSRDLDALVQDLLDERMAGPIPPSLATEFLALPVAPAAARLFEILRSHPTAIAIRTIPPLLGSLAMRDDRWNRVVVKSIARQGRCPKNLRAAVLQAMKGGSSSPFASRATPIEEGDEVLRGSKTPKSLEVSVRKRKAPARIGLTTQSTSLNGIRVLVDALAEVDASGGLVLDLTDVDHLYVTGLTLLAAWCIERSVRPQLEGASAATEHYLQRIGFHDVLEGKLYVDRGADGGWRVAIAPIDRASSADLLAAEIVGICDRRGFVGKADHNALLVAFAELIENVQRHAGIERTALVSAQYYPARKKLTATVVDTGFGIHLSFLAGTNSVAKDRIRAGEDPLRLATLPLVTSRPVRIGDDPGHAGYGLYVVSEIAVRNGGTFLLTSGEKSLCAFRKMGRRRTETVSHKAWKGTIVAILFDLENLLPMSDVYASLPAPQGFEMEDFFGGD
ncbi:MAG: hypothetical protein ACT4PV_05735 [Planctomycetaceae bacterium]